MYWSILRNTCKATGRWPTEKHLHSELKWACGYVKMRWNSLASAHMRIMDSISFDDMSQQEFNQYFELSMQKHLDMTYYRPTYETKNHLIKEEELAQYAAFKWNCEMRKQDKYNQFDYVALNKGCVEHLLSYDAETIIMHNIQRALSIAKLSGAHAMHKLQG